MSSGYSWGESPARDRVRALYAGFGSRASERVAVVIQAFMDESKGDRGTLVIGGVVVGPRQLEDLTKEWEALLPLAPVNRAGQRVFKYSHMATSDHFRAHLPAFYRVIEKNVAGLLSIRFNVNDLRSAVARIRVNDRPVIMRHTPYQFALIGLLNVFNDRRDEMFNGELIDRKVDFFFDDTSDKKAIMSTFDTIRSYANFPERWGNDPIFRPDDELIALQSGDFIAGYVRECGERGVAADFSSFNPKRDIPHVLIESDEKGLIENLVEGLKRQLSR